MDSVSKAFLDNCMLSVGWDDIPTEIYLLIFKKLDITSLRCCFRVSRKWEEIATYVCQEQDLWQALVEDGLVNHGVTQHLKSTLCWKDLYFNSLLWNQLPRVVANKLHSVDKPDTRNLHVYRDKLIVVNADSVEYYNINIFKTIRLIQTTCCVDVQESDDIMLVVTDMYSDGGFRVSVFIKLHKDEEVNVDNYLVSWIMPADRSIHAFVECWYWRLVGDRVYIIDSRSVLWECSAKSNTLSVKALAKFYGQIPRSGCKIHVLEEDVYLPFNMGRLLMVRKNSKRFQLVNTMEIPTKIIEGSKSNMDEAVKENNGTFSAFTKFPFGVDFTDKEIAPLGMIHYQYDDAKMTCGLQHGDVVFRGFKNGEITIHLLRDGCTYKLNVQQFDHGVREHAMRSGRQEKPYWWSEEIASLRHMKNRARRAYTRCRRRRQHTAEEEALLYEALKEAKEALSQAVGIAKEVKKPAVIAMEIFEIKGMHKLFVATKHKLYVVLLTYPNSELE